MIFPFCPEKKEIEFDDFTPHMIEINSGNYTQH